MFNLRGTALVLFSLLLTTSVISQTRPGTGNVHIRVTLPNGRSAPPRLLVQLMDGASSTPVDTHYTDDTGATTFLNVSPGYFHVMVSGDGYQKADSGLFEVDTRKMTQSESVSIQPLESGSGDQSDQATVSAADLKVPQSARKELEKANQAMEHEDWKKALDRLNHAIAISPTYASAYNNIGVIYGRLNDPVHEREALEKAISLDDHFAEAMVNLAKLCFRTNDFVQAQMLLEKVLPLTPGNVHNLLLLANAQLLNSRFDAAIANAQKVHSLSHDHSPLAHFIAARALEHENRAQDALAQLQTFLQEEPKGPRADHVRDEISNIRRQVQ